MSQQRIPLTKTVRIVGALITGMVMMRQVNAGGLLAYELGTADVGLATAGIGARAQDASTVFTNPAGMTRLEGNQVLVAGQIMWADTEFTIDAGTSPELGGEEGGKAIGSNGWLPGGSGFFSYTMAPDLKLGFALTANFGAPLEYEDDWVGRYYVKETTLLGVSLLPSIAYQVNDRLSLGASLNAMYGLYDNRVAINNVNPSYGDGQLKLDDSTWGWGLNLGLLYEIDARTRLGLTWNSSVDLDFETSAEFSDLAPGLYSLLSDRGLLNADIDIGIKVPQQLMGSLFMQLDERWALLASLGWQDWSEFGQVQIGIDNTSRPSSLTSELEFDDTWHVALGAQYKMRQPWLLNFGIAYDSEFQEGSNVSPLMPINSAWRFGIGLEQHTNKAAYLGFAAEYLYGGTLDTELQSTLPVSLGGRGDVIGSYEHTSTLFVSAYYNWTF